MEAHFYVFSGLRDTKRLVSGSLPAIASACCLLPSLLLAQHSRLGLCWVHQSKPGFFIQHLYSFTQNKLYYNRRDQSPIGYSPSKPLTHGHWCLTLSSDFSSSKPSAYDSPSPGGGGSFSSAPNLVTSLSLLTHSYTSFLRGTSRPVDV